MSLLHFNVILGGEADSQIADMKKFIFLIL